MSLLHMLHELRCQYANLLLPAGLSNVLLRLAVQVGRTADDRAAAQLSLHCNARHGGMYACIATMW